MQKRNTGWIKKLDYYAGIPLVYTLGLLKKKRLCPTRIQSIGILMSAALGDTTLLTGILQDLRAAYPDARLLLFTGETNSGLLPHLPGISEGVVLPIKNPLEAFHKINEYAVDLFIDAGSWPRINSLLTLAADAKWTVGFKTKGQGRHFAYDCPILHRADRHELDNYRALLSPLEVPTTHMPKLKLTVDYPMPATYGIFHLWASSYMYHLREWPFKYWREVVQRMPYPIYLTGSKEDAPNNEAFMDFCSRPSHVHNLAGKTTLAQSLSVLAKAHVVVSVNTGVMHMAAALGTRTIGLCGPAPASRWGALGARSTNLAPLCSGHGFLNLGFEFKGRRTDCMEHLPPSLVLNALEKDGSALRGLGVASSTVPQ